MAAWGGGCPGARIPRERGCSGLAANALAYPVSPLSSSASGASVVAIDNKIEQAMVSRYPRTVLRDPPHPGWVLCPERAPRSPAGSRAHGAFVCPSRLAEPVGAGSAAVRGELPGGSPGRTLGRDQARSQG